MPRRRILMIVLTALVAAAVTVWLGYVIATGSGANIGTGVIAGVGILALLARLVLFRRGPGK